MKKKTTKLMRKVYYMHKPEIQKVDRHAKKQKVSGSIIIRQLIAELPE